MAKDPIEIEGRKALLIHQTILRKKGLKNMKRGKGRRERDTITADRTCSRDVRRGSAASSKSRNI
jgi:hypothetical protein